MIIGIDLGTTNSVAAHMSSERPELIPNAVGTYLTPSVVGVEESGEVLVGHAAQEYQVLQPARCAALFKRHMGSETTIQLGSRSFTPEELSALVLGSLKADAEAYLGQEVKQAVITVPAYFNDAQRKATMRAGQLAGLRVERIINEPTAAAIAYGLHEADEEKIVAVFDLGGGTFDVSLVDLFDGAVEVRASAGECFLGGEDFTRSLAARVLEQQGLFFERAELESPLQVARLIDQCERVKRDLTRTATATLQMPNKQGECSSENIVEVTRQQFSEWTKHLLARIETPVRRSLGDARLTVADVNEVILVGGATRMPAVTERVTQLFQRAPLCRMNPDEVVALGAAVQAGLIARHAAVDDLVVTDVCPFTLGVEISKQLGTEFRDGYFSPIINRNTTIPVSRVERMATLTANQPTITLKIYQGESRRVRDNLLLGKLEVSGLPMGPAGQEVDVRFTYDLNGVLEVEAEIVATGKKLTEVITQHVHGLSKAEIAAAVASMQAIKTHPREETKNRYLLKRAERLFQELDLYQRTELTSLIDGFEAALEMQEPEAIAAHAEALETFLERFDSSSSNDDPWESDGT